RARGASPCRTDSLSPAHASDGGAQPIRRPRCADHADAGRCSHRDRRQAADHVLPRGRSGAAVVHQAPRNVAEAGGAMGDEGRAMTDRSTVGIVGFGACTSLGYSLESSLAAMGAGLNNFTDTAIPNEFGHATVAASLIDPRVPRGERLVALFR